MSHPQLFPPEPLLLIDDEVPWLRSLKVTLKRFAGFNHIVQCTDSRNALSQLQERRFSLVILDLNMPHLSGEELLSQIVEEHPHIPVIILSGMNQLETAVQCMKLGAFDYFVKTAEKERLIASIHQALLLREKENVARKLKSALFDQKLKHPEVFQNIVTASSDMHKIFLYIEAIASSSEPVLIMGESGVGKEEIALTVQKLSRPGQPFVPVNAAGLDDEMFADTLFGHEKGAFTDAVRDRTGMVKQAGGGVLFLDEIGDLSLASQVKLLRLIQENEFHPLGSDVPEKNHARLVFATNRDLYELQASGRFRKDLYYRLNAHQVQVPPLHQRKEDIPGLLEHFVAEAAQKMQKKSPTIPEELLLLLHTYDFPGNIRELRAMAYNAVSLSKGHKLSMASFEKAIQRERKQDHSVEQMRPQTAQQTVTAVFPGQLPSLREGAELLVAEAMKRADGNVRIAAGMLGISRQALAKRLSGGSS